MRDTITAFLNTSAEIKRTISDDSALLASIEGAAQQLCETRSAGGTIYNCGNGGSACDAIHFTEELVARYKREREGIRSMHFCDPGTLTCWSNDYEFASVFSRQVSTFCGPKDTLVAFSTSGNSENILRAVEAAKATSTPTIGLAGKGGGKLASSCDYPIVVPSDETDRIQEAHITIVHIFCELLEA